MTTNVLAFLIFWVGYPVLYMLPVFAVFIVSDVVGDRFPEVASAFESLGPIARVSRGVLGVVGLFLFIIGAYRANAAVDAVSTGDMDLAQAHGYSGAMVRALIGSIPVIGRVIGTKQDR